MTVTLLMLMVVLLVDTGCATNTIEYLCPNCGTTPVPYPLSTSWTCGQPSYRLRCEGGVLKFDTLIDNYTYPIISISPENQRLVIQQPSTILPNTCVSVTHGIRLNTSLPFTITSSNTPFFFNCSNTTALPAATALDCTTTSPCRAYQNGSAKMSACGQTAPTCCSLKNSTQTGFDFVSLAMEHCGAYTNFVNLNLSLPISRWPDSAVELMWALPSERPCQTQTCCDSTYNSVCRDDGDGSLRCYCKPKFRWDGLAGRCVSDLISVRSKQIKLVAATTCSGVILLLLVVFATVMIIRYNNRSKAEQRLARDREEIVSSGDSGKSSKVFTSKEIKRATNNYSSKGLLGVGGFGEVYKGVLDDGTEVAVKCAKLGNTKSVDQVLNEVRILCQVNHKNLVHLLGCCIGKKEPLLVYEYIPNGSLHDHLHDKNKIPLTWPQRLGIARDTAEGLSYLHFSASRPIYHRDVKSSNILLDENMKAKVADFGLSRLAHTDLTHVTTCAQGTLGYLDPDYYWNYQLTDKSDVYSFGVLLLEILTCQKAIDFGRATDDVNLVAYVKRMVNEERMVDVIDSMLKNPATSLEIDSMKALGFLAMSCLEERRENRPSMKEVSEEIEYIMGVIAVMV
ncbi:unnamed protein product [Lactuca virosa]|uniref:Protein kinase domain-containing protein n=1 Tax=Lactuca virosa TaxID=75947 RepID=A0AAU9MQD0_9ASTR|nr:unnamed protein product [Lactuca virosa]